MSLPGRLEDDLEKNCRLSAHCNYRPSHCILLLEEMLLRPAAARLRPLGRSVPHSSAALASRRIRWLSANRSLRLCRYRSGRKHYFPARTRIRTVGGGRQSRRPPPEKKTRPRGGDQKKGT